MLRGLVDPERWEATRRRGRTRFVWTFGSAFGAGVAYLEALRRVAERHPPFTWLTVFTYDFLGHLLVAWLTEG